ncbi:MAG: hypothetical protein ACOYNL_04600 [Rickettsiales bacterium]
MVETRSLNYSIVLHALALLIAAVGLPAILPPRAEPMPLVMTVELLPVGEVTNVKPSEQQIQKEQKAPEPKVKTPLTPPAPTPVKQTTAPPPPKEKTFDPMEGAEEDPEAEAIKKTPPKEKAKPKAEEKKPPQDDFKKLLDSLSKEAEKNNAVKPAAPAPNKDAKDKVNMAENKTRSDAPYDESMPLSISEKDTIRSQFMVCWTMPAGAKDAHTLAARVKVTMQADGTVTSAVLAPEQMGRYNSDTFFRAAADSAIRAVHKCSPLKNLPPDKYGSWREMELNFDPQDMV